MCPREWPVGAGGGDEGAGGGQDGQISGAAGSLHLRSARPDAPRPAGLCYIFYCLLRTAHLLRLPVSLFRPHFSAHMRIHLSVAILASSLLAACSVDSVVGVVNPYRIDVRQGNYVDQEMLSQLKRGMTADQVRFALGSPLVVDAFRSDRWDYIYRFKPGSGEAEQRVVSVFFVNGVLDHVAGDVEGGEGEAGGLSTRSRVIEVPGSIAQ